MIDPTDKHHPVFQLVVPPYTPTSNGVMVLYHLGDLIEALGCTVLLLSTDPQSFEQHKDKYPARYLARFRNPSAVESRELITILPEAIDPESLPPGTGQHRVWYLLNRPYAMSKAPTGYQPHDLVVAYSGLISKTYFNLFLTREIPEAAPYVAQNSHRATKENLVLVYFGKSRHSNLPPAALRVISENKAETVVIHRTYPAEREELFALLAKARLLISFDPLTNLTYEATLCQTPCYVADNHLQIKYDDFNIPLLGMFEDEQKIEAHFRDGIPDSTYATIKDLYFQTNKASLERTRQFISLCESWFDLVENSRQSPALSRLLKEHNILRLQNDLLAHQLRTRLLTNESQGRPQQQGRIGRRMERIKANILRAWHKHIKPYQGESPGNHIARVWRSIYARQSKKIGALFPKS